MTRIPTSCGVLEIEVFDRDAPLASRCLRQQITNGAWTSAHIEHVTAKYAKLEPATGLTPQLRKENRRQLFGRRGLVAYGAGTTAELLFFTQNCPNMEIGTVVGRLTRKSLVVLDSITDRERVDDTLADPVPVGTKRSNPTRSVQLQRVLEFERRLNEVK